MVFMAFGLPEWAEQAVRAVARDRTLPEDAVEELEAAVARALATPHGVHQGTPEERALLEASLDHVVSLTLRNHGSATAQSVRTMLEHLGETEASLWPFGDRR